MNTDIFTQNSAQDVPLDTFDKETIAQEVQESVLRRVVSEILQEDKEETSKWAKAAAGGVTAGSETRDLGRKIKRSWQADADIASFNSVTFVHWNGISSIFDLVQHPRSRDEISTLPYNKTPWTPLNLGRHYILGVIVKGRPTLVANADLNSLSYTGLLGVKGQDARSEAIKKMRARTKMSGYNKYPGMKSPGADAEKREYGDGWELARSWEDYIVYSASEIFPHEMISFDTKGVFDGFDNKGWPEALLDNWKVVGIVVPQKTVNDLGGTANIYQMIPVINTSKLPIYDENGQLYEYKKKAVSND